MKKETIVGVVTSEKTWQTLSRYCFNDNFVNNRKLFDLAVVLNGKDNDGIEFIKRLSPDYFYMRHNVGRDPAGFDHLIRNIPSYETYILLHDDHWFNDKDWFETIKTLMTAHKDIDIFGNLVDVDYFRPPNYNVISMILGLAEYQQEYFPFFLQGLAGIFRQKPIEKLLELDGIPHTHGNNREVGEVCERIFSFILLRHGFKFMQLPPGYEKYLRHKDYHDNSPAYQKL